MPGEQPIQRYHVEFGYELIEDDNGRAVLYEAHLAKVHDAVAAERAKWEEAWERSKNENSAQRLAELKEEIPVLLDMNARAARADKAEARLAQREKEMGAALIERTAQLIAHRTAIRIMEEHAAAAVARVEKQRDALRDVLARVLDADVYLSDDLHDEAHAALEAKP